MVKFRIKYCVIAGILGSVLVGYGIFKWGGKRDYDDEIRLATPPKYTLPSKTTVVQRDIFGWKAKPGPSIDGIPYFDLFTCPSIQRVDGKLVFRTYSETIVEDTFPIYLYAIRPKPYRIKIETYTMGSNDMPPRITITDTETGKTIECVPGKRYPELRLFVKSFTTKELAKNGVLLEVPQLLVYDDDLQTDLQLTNSQKYLENYFIVVLRDTNGKEYIIRNVGEKIDIGEATCTLRYINPTEGYAKLVLTDANGHDFNKVVHLIR